MNEPKSDSTLNNVVNSDVELSLQSRNFKIASNHKKENFTTLHDDVNADVGCSLEFDNFKTAPSSREINFSYTSSQDENTAVHDLQAEQKSNMCSDPRKFDIYFCIHFSEHSYVDMKKSLVMVKLHLHISIYFFNHNAQGNKSVKYASKYLFCLLLN